MSTKISLNYPIFIPTKGRANNCKTADLLEHWNTPYTLVVEESDLKPYKAVYPNSDYLVLPKSNQGLSYARNHIKQVAKAIGYDYHWQLDDDIKSLGKRINGKNVKVDPQEALGDVEEIVDGFSNVAVAGLRDSVFAWTQTTQVSINKQIASVGLFNSLTEQRWADNIIEDTDYAIQTLLAGYCTVIFNRIIYNKAPNNVAKGGQQDYSTSYNELKRNLVKKYPHFFKLTKDKKGRDKVAPSRVWRSFNQKLIPNESTVPNLHNI